MQIYPEKNKTALQTHIVVPNKVEHEMVPGYSYQVNATRTQLLAIIVDFSSIEQFFLPGRGFR